MDLDLIVFDTSVMIDYFGKTDKANSFFEKLLKFKKGFCFSVITNYEIMIGSNEKQRIIWDVILEDIPHSQVAKTAVKIYNQLKAINKLVPFQDIAIAATALHYNYEFGSMNEKHFRNITGLKLLTPSMLS